MWERHLIWRVVVPLQIWAGSDTSTRQGDKLQHTHQPFGGHLTRKFEFPAAGVAVVFGAEVPDGVVSQVGGSKDHIVRAEGRRKEVEPSPRTSHPPSTLELLSNRTTTSLSEVKLTNGISPQRVH